MEEQKQEQEQEQARGRHRRDLHIAGADPQQRAVFASAAALHRRRDHDAGEDRRDALVAGLGFGRIVASEIEVPITFGNLV
jgi:hypothetical protein